MKYLDTLVRLLNFKKYSIWSVQRNSLQTFKMIVKILKNELKLHDN